MEELLLNHYNLNNVSLQKMEGYISTNYKVDAQQGTFVLKVYPAEAKEDVLAETEMIEHLTHLNASSLSKPIPNTKAELITLVNINGEAKLLRLLTFVEGDFLAEVNQTPDLLYSLGQFMAEIDKSLLHFRNKGIEARKLDWDLQHINQCRALRTDISDPAERKLVDYFFLQWDQQVYPQLAGLRKAIIHNDANDWNILVKENQVSGIIDFGDSVYTPLINELAIAITYSVFGKDDPIASALPIIEGYTSILKLFEEEIDLLYYLIAGRLIMSVCKSAHEKKLKPESEYITISEKPAWDLLRKWVTINPLHAKNEFRKAAGLSLQEIPEIDEVLERRYTSLSPILSVSYKKPIYMESAAFDPLQEYAEKLLSKFPSTLNKVYFVNSGSAASDLAVRLAQTYSQKQGMVVMEHGYHGNTRMGIDISPYKYQSKGGKGKAHHIIEAVIPDTYRGAYRNNNGEAGMAYANDLLEKIRSHEGGIADFIAEPIIGCGGQVPLAKGYLQAVYPAIRAQGGVCISDEVQTGFGRMGNHFWGYEMQGVVPDIVILGKPMGNGHPMGAVVTTEAIAEAFNNGMEFFSSFGGNPVSCAIGSAVLDVIEEEQLQQNASMVGDYFMDQLRQLQNEFTTIGDVRGSGLFIGVEFIKDDQLTPNTELAQRIKNELRNRHILVSTDGPYDSVIKSKPPLCFTKSNVDQVIEEMRQVLSTNSN